MGKAGSDNKKQDRQGFEPDSSPGEIRTIKIDELHFDDRNANKGTEEGKRLISNSISKFGAGRGVLVDKNLKLIAGNHAVREMQRQGIENVIIVPTDGKTLVVTQRTDIDKDSKEGHGLALADNRAAEANLNFDVDVIRELDAEFELDLDDLGIDLTPGGGPFFAPIHEDYNDGDEDESDAADQMEASNEKDTDSKSSLNLFPLAVMLTKAEQLSFNTWKKQNNCKDDTQGFLLMFNQVK